MLEFLLTNVRGIPMKKTSDILVVGAGVVGAMLTYHLAKQGCNVRLIERTQPGTEASGAYAGLLTTVAEGSGQGPYLELSKQALNTLLDTVDTLQEETGIDVGLEHHPLYRVATNAEERESLLHSINILKKQDSDTSWCEANDLLQESKLFSPRLFGAIRSNKEYHLTPSLLLKAIIKGIEQHDSIITTDARVTGLLKEGKRIVGVSTEYDHYFADQVVLASGSWTPELLKTLNLNLRVKPIAGQMLKISTPDLQLPFIVNTPRGYLVPKLFEQSVVIGATQEDKGFKKEITMAGITHLIRVMSTIPSLVHSSLHSTFVGLRPTSFDGMPLLGPVPDWEGLTLSTGHSQHGILLSDLTARMVSASLLGRDTGDLWQHFLVDRGLQSLTEQSMEVNI
jgi:glycine oxidase